MAAAPSPSISPTDASADMLKKQAGVAGLAGLLAFCVWHSKAEVLSLRHISHHSFPPIRLAVMAHCHHPHAAPLCRRPPSHQ